MTRPFRIIAGSQDVVGTKPKPATDVYDFGLFAQPAPPQDSKSLTLHQKFAEDAANSADGAKLLEVAERCARAIIAAQGSFTIAEVRLSLEKMGLLENLGKENLHALGALGRRMGCRVIGRERAPAALGVAHGNLHSRWAF